MVLAGVYVILCVAVSIYTERHQIKNSEDDLESYRSYCNKLKNYLINDRKISLNIFSELIARLNTMNDKLEEKIDRKHERFSKFMEMLLIPISAVILGALLDKEINVNEVLNFGLSGLLIILFTYGLILFVSFLYDFVMRAPQGRYKRFATDLQSILDFELCESDTVTDDAVIAPALNETSAENNESESQTIC